MSKYKAYLAENYTGVGPFITDWDYELLSDKLRLEFDDYFAIQEGIAGAGGGKTKQLIKGDYVKRFMVSKKVNLVDNPINGNLKSVFLLRKDEEKVVDDRAMKSLDGRFGYKTKETSDGLKSDPTGFIKFELIGKSAETVEKEQDSLQVTGNDIQYFQEEEEKPAESEEKAEIFVCEVCEKEFSTQRALNAHSLSHRKDK